MKKVIAITAGLLITIAIIVVGLWQKSSYTAKKEGRQVLSFQQFIGLDKRSASKGTGSDSLSSGFNTITPPLNTTTTDSISTENNTADIMIDGITETTENAINTISNGVFTGTGSFTPSTSGGQSGRSDGFQNTETYNSPRSGNGSVITGSTVNTNNGVTKDSVVFDPNRQNSQNNNNNRDTRNEECSRADMTLNFTDSELQQLQDLKNQLSSIQSKLASADQVDTAKQNYDALALSYANYNESVTFCRSLLVDKNGHYKQDSFSRRLATPYWHEDKYGSEDNNSFIDEQPRRILSMGQVCDNCVPGDPNGLDINPGDTFEQYTSEIEKTFKLHIW